jgi:anti-anti-sigma factor
VDDDLFPVRWAGRQAIVSFPGHVDISNAGQLRDRLLAVINRGPAVLIADMSLTASCDHAAMEAVARACQRAAIDGTQVRLVVTAPVVRRVLSLEGLDRVVSIYPSVEAAAAAGPAARAAGPAARAAGPAARGPRVAGTSGRITPAVLWNLLDALGDGLLLAGQDGKVALVNQRCAEMFGYAKEEMAGLPVDALVPSDVRAAHFGFRADYQAGPEPRPMAERSRLAAQRKDGATLPVEISLSPVPTASETFVLAVIRDATGRRPREDLLGLAQGAASGPASHATRDLLDRVVQRLFQVGLSLQAAGGLPGEVARAHLAEAVNGLDEVIGEIRDYAFGSGDPAPLGTG